MRYFTHPSGQQVREAIAAGRLGAVSTQGAGNTILPGWHWFRDNGCYSGQSGGDTYPGPAAFLRGLELRGRGFGELASCAFAVAPDVLGDPAETLARSKIMLDPMRRLGYRVAFVLQDGCTPGLVPWPDIDVVFIGGSAAWKHSPAVRPLTDRALEAGLGVHWGRGNCWWQIEQAVRMHVTSMDGGGLARYPASVPVVLEWLRAARALEAARDAMEALW